MPHFMRTRSARIVAVAAVLVALYALAGFVIAPKLVRSALIEDIPKALPHVKVSVGEIHINPFLLDVEIKDFALADEAGEKVAGFERIYVDFEYASIWHRAYTFGHVDLQAPFISARVAKDGSLNLNKLRPPPKQRLTTKAQEGTLPRIRVELFKITRGSVSYTDRSLPTEFTERLEPVEFELKDFTTGADGGLFSLAGASKLGEKFEWHGHLSVQPVESDGELRIEGLQAHTLWEYVADRLNFAVNSGRIDAKATYRFAVKDAPLLEVKVPELAMTDLTVRPKNADADWITLPSLTVNAASFDLAERRAQVESVSLTGLKVTSWRELDGSINLLQLAGAATAATVSSVSTAPQTSTASPTPPAATSAAPASPPVAVAAGAPWRFDLGRFELKDASLSAEDRTTKPAAKLVLAPLAAEVSGVSLDLSRPVHVKLETHINQTGSLSVSGDVTPQPATASLSLKLDALDLTAVQPYIAQHSAMTLRSGRLGGDGQLRYAGPQAKPAFQFSGNVHVDALHTLDNVRQDDFVNWDRLDILGLNYQMAPDRLDIAAISASKPYARVTIGTDSTLNVSRVLAATGSAPVPSASTGPPAAAASAVKRTHRDPAKSAALASAPAAAPSTPMSIKKIEIKGGTTNFTDLSVAPTFSAGIQNLGGSVLGLSSEPNSRAKIDLHGSVDAYSPVSISGEVNVLSAATYADVAMSFRNIELSIFNPYSGKFAGYNISKGKLTTELHYKVENRQLDAQHHIVIDQLEFGEKTASKDAVSLPLKLGVALLKDSHGVIDLDLPISGSLDDPKFRIAPLVWKVIVNLLEKAITAPFALLGRLFGGGPDLEFVDFQPGNPAPDAAGVDKMKTVAKALAERPQLKIDVPIGVVPDLDRPALAAAKLDAQIADLQAQGRGAKSSAGGSAPPVSWNHLDPAVQIDLLTRLYTHVAGGPPKYPDSVAAIKPKADAAAAKIQFLSTEIRAHEAVGDVELRALGEQRAQALQQTLLTDTQIDPARVFLVANDKAIVKDGVVRLQLSLK